MISTTLLTVGAFVAGANAHYRLLEPTWRGSSFEEPASQWIYPCANVNETTDMANRTQWPVTGGSVLINGSHEHALTSVNLALGSNATNFNITLVELFNQTGAGLYCTKEAGKDTLEAAFKAAGYSGFDDERLDGLAASIQVIQLGHSGAALYNCADIQFNRTAKIEENGQCQNGTGVSGVAIQNVDGNSSSSPSPTSSGTGGAQSSNAAVKLGSAAGSGLVVALMAWGFL